MAFAATLARRAASAIEVGAKDNALKKAPRRDPELYVRSLELFRLGDG